ncbi:hypothetical protein [Cupriavidus pauculus]|uniref:Glycosyl hydrolase family 32 N-terminal domain-containing protein n=1 Tax=Cupriavidus pauculus TaxID=82633 RepID=A0A2N5CH15_9BURK|nr:hypothetical protein [Cupriavidus pauculus]PLQ01536.1 hypothetical protein CYJ10_07630 [Cupriavidus pauculus]
MQWTKLGQLFCPKDIHPKLMSHAANPLAIHLEDDIYRVLYSGRDAQNRSSVGYVDIDIVARRVVYVHDQPLCVNGPEGSFYSHGISIGNCYEANGRRYILFMGWQYPPGGHWRGDVGRLILHDDFSLQVDSETPFMASDAVDPVSLSYPWVLRQDDGSYRMWYGSTVTWDAGNGEMLHVINHASSDDGHTWQRHGLAVPFALGTAQAFSHPSVIRNPAGGYQMWFSYRCGSGQTYRIGYAESPDGIRWGLELAQTGIDVSDEGWDSEMIEYPFVFDHKGQRYMLYNGNSNGKTGFGLAVLSKEVNA